MRPSIVTARKRRCTTAPAHCASAMKALACAAESKTAMYKKVALVSTDPSASRHTVLSVCRAWVA
eukprot:COSAG01_NODE_467_length_16597_cov_10.933446_14_plen_65_part_00